MADTYDHLEWKNGFRVDGAAMSIYSIITVAVGGICTGVFNILLSKTGYIAPSLVDGVTVAATGCSEKYDYFLLCRSGSDHFRHCICTAYVYQRRKGIKGKTG